MIKIELTTEQANILLQLVEIAMKAGNINNVKAGLPLYDLILDAAKVGILGNAVFSDPHLKTASLALGAFAALLTCAVKAVELYRKLKNDK